jgi:hypothetical protein
MNAQDHFYSSGTMSLVEEVKFFGRGLMDMDG